MIAFKMKYMSFIFMGREIQMIIDEADVDHDGLIDYTEFFSMMNPKQFTVVIDHIDA